MFPARQVGVHPTASLSEHCCPPVDVVEGGGGKGQLGGGAVGRNRTPRVGNGKVCSGYERVVSQAVFEGGRGAAHCLSFTHAALRQSQISVWHRRWSMLCFLPRESVMLWLRLQIWACVLLAGGSSLPVTDTHLTRRSPSCQSPLPVGLHGHCAAAAGRQFCENGNDLRGLHGPERGGVREPFCAPVPRFTPGRITKLIARHLSRAAREMQRRERRGGCLASGRAKGVGRGLSASTPHMLVCACEPCLRRGLLGSHRKRHQKEYRELPCLLAGFDRPPRRCLATHSRIPPQKVDWRRRPEACRRCLR